MSSEVDLERRKQIIIEVHSNLFNRAAAYTNVIIVAGYAGGFAIWNFTREILGDTAELWVALLLLISVVTFVIFEVFKMIVNFIFMFKLRSVIGRDLSDQEFFDEIRNHEETSGRNTFRIIVPFWILSVGIAVISAFVAVIICLWTFISILIS